MLVHDQYLQKPDFWPCLILTKGAHLTWAHALRTLNACAKNSIVPTIMKEFAKGKHSFRHTSMFVYQYKIIVLDFIYFKNKKNHKYIKWYATNSVYIYIYKHIFILCLTYISWLCISHWPSVLAQSLPLKRLIT